MYETNMYWTIVTIMIWILSSRMRRQKRENILLLMKIKREICMCLEMTEKKSIYKLYECVRRKCSLHFIHCPINSWKKNDISPVKLWKASWWICIDDSVSMNIRSIEWIGKCDNDNTIFASMCVSQSCTLHSVQSACLLKLNENKWMQRIATEKWIFHFIFA